MARAAVLLLLACGVVAPPGAALAAPLRGQGFLGGRPPAAGVMPFNVDPAPCGPEARQPSRDEAGRSTCRDIPPSRLPRGNNGSRRPGSNAFGLQFDPYGE